MFLIERIIDMKKYLILILALFMVLLVSCNKETSNNTEASSKNTIQHTQTTEHIETAPDPQEDIIDTMEKLTEVDGVIDITKQTFSSQIRGAVAYKVLYESVNGKLSADVVLPDDYSSKGGKYTVLIYFPQVKTFIETLATNFALNDIIVIRPYERGFGESEGIRDLGGENDLVDANALIDIFDKTSFIGNSKIFIAGSGTGSINALRLIAEDTSNRISGCAVIDSITDLPLYCEFRGDGVTSLVTALIGNTYDEAPEEYHLRSAVKFTEKLDRPVLLLHYLQSPMFSVEHTDTFYDVLSQTNDECTYNKLDESSSDFQGESLKRLLSWINRYD